MDRVIDHVVFAGSHLETLRDAFAGAGLDTEYGGEHSNGVTHNAVLGFPDGSYVELISTIEGGTGSPWWDAPIREDGGPCAWAIDVEDIDAEARRIADLGIDVDGPTHHTRERPDGVTIEFDLAVLGTRGMGATYPLVVHDRTPRSDRIDTAESIEGTALTGVREAVVAVRRLDEWVDGFRRLFDSDEPEPVDATGFGGRIARFPGAPVTLAEPLSDGSWLATRLDLFGPRPCGYLLGTADAGATADRFDLRSPEVWGAGRVRWFDLDVPGRLGVIE